MPLPAETPKTSESFVGWYRQRPKGRWIEACTAPTYDAAWWLLLAVETPTGDVDKVVLASDQMPTEKRR